MIESTMDFTAGLYQHYKGHVYRAFWTSKHTETGEIVVVYQALYGNFGYFHRPLDAFQEIVSCAGKAMPRFQLIAAESTPEFSELLERLSWTETES